MPCFTDKSSINVSSAKTKHLILKKNVQITIKYDHFLFTSIPLDIYRSNVYLRTILLFACAVTRNQMTDYIIKIQSFMVQREFLCACVCDNGRWLAASTELLKIRFQEMLTSLMLTLTYSCSLEKWNTAVCGLWYL